MKYNLLIILIIVGILSSHAQHNEYEIWSFKTGDRIYSHPVVQDHIVYFGSNDGYFYAVDVNSGTELWKFQTEFSIRSSSAILDSIIYFKSADNCFAINRFTGDELWSYINDNSKETVNFDPWDYHHGRPVVYEGTVYFGCGDGVLYGFDPHNGNLKMKYVAIDSAAIRSTPVIHDGIMYFGDWNGRIYALDLTSRDTLWVRRTYTEQQYPTFGQVNTELAIYDNLLVFGARNPEIRVLDIKTGDWVWNYEVFGGGWISGNPVVVNDTMYITGSDCHKLFAFDVHTGELYWDFEFSYNSFSKPLVCGDYLLITSGNAYANNGSNYGRGYLDAVNRKDGTIKNFALIGGNAWCNPVSYEGKLFVCSDDHHLYALDSAKVLTNNVNIEETGYEAVKLMSIFPRPFFEEVMIVYEVHYNAKITIKIYDFYGGEVKFLYKGKRKKGEYTIEWDGIDDNGNEVPQGAYFVDIGSGDYYKSGIILRQ